MKRVQTGEEYITTTAAYPFNLEVFVISPFNRPGKVNISILSTASGTEQRRKQKLVSLEMTHKV